MSRAPYRLAVAGLVPCRRNVLSVHVPVIEFLEFGIRLLRERIPLGLSGRLLAWGLAEKVQALFFVVLLLSKLSTA